MATVESRTTKLNKKFHFMITAPEDGAKRWIGTENTARAAQWVTKKSLGVAVEFGLSEDTAIEMSKKISDAISNNLYKNGISGLVFRSFLTEYPQIGIDNQYSPNTAIGGLINAVTNIIGGTVNFAGGITPNLNVEFQFPEMWKGQSPLNLRIETIVTPDTAISLPAEIEGQRLWTHLSPGARVFNAVIIGIMLGAPRQFGASSEVSSVEDLFLAAPPTCDVKIGPLLLPSVRVGSVDVSWPKDEAYYDESGLPTIAKLTFSIRAPLTYTQDNWNKFRTNINSIRSGDVEEAKLETIQAIIKSGAGIKKEIGKGQKR